MKMTAISTLLLTATASFILLILTISGLAASQAQPDGDVVYAIPGREALASGSGGFDPPIDELSDADRQAIQDKINQNVTQLRADGAFSTDQTTAVTFSWPLSTANGLADYGYHGISNFVDHDSRYGYLLDYSCGDRTYDLSGYNHKGTDFFTWPFAWNKMDNDEVVVVAAAPGTIVYKEDGNYDRSCAIGGGSWNAVYVRHHDGSIAWYGHMKSGSLTAKSVGDTVVTGEVLGVVGSSGSSTGPHLHLELYADSSLVNLVDPYNGSCNPSVSWWQEQRPYYDSAVNKVMVGSAPVETPDCPAPAITHEQTEFNGGDTIYFTTYYRDQLAGQISQYTIYQPDGAIYQSWSAGSNANHYAASWWWWSYQLPTDAMSGNWRFEVVFNGQTYETTFKVGNYIAVATPGGGEFWLPGSTYTISWQSNVTGPVQIDLLKNTLYSTTITTTVSDGSHAWTIPVSSTVGLGYQIRIADAGDTAVADTSQPFAIGSREQFNHQYLPLTMKENQ